MKFKKVLASLIAAMAGGFLISFTVVTVTCVASAKACRVLCAHASIGEQSGIAVVAVTVMYLMLPFSVVTWVVLRKTER
jgi:hypothetical protein